MATVDKIKPLGDRVLVEPIEEKEVRKGGIIIPELGQGETAGRDSAGPWHRQGR